jgi:type II secretory pathway predicted ATPase ExeA/septal ring-binding cell division protein DamX
METEQMHKAQHATHPSLFDHGLFFPDSGRQATLEALKKAVAGSASLITCVGEEGHGKTTLCKILEKEFQEPYLVISFPYSVESFDYVLQVIALKLNIDLEAVDSGMGSGKLLVEIIRVLREQGRSMLILFDEAEKLYLATLERIRKMIDLANEGGVLLQILLFGRMGFRSHIEQLAQCTFKQAQEVHLTLPPLTAEDTFQYLNLCMGQGAGAKDKEIFSREVSTKILTISHGNFRKINTLAEDSLQSSYGSGESTGAAGDATSFMVLLEHVRDTDDLATSEPPSNRFSSLLQQKNFIIGAGIALITILIFVSLGREAKKTGVSHQPKKTQSISNPQAAPPTPNKKAEIVPPPTQPAPEMTVDPTVKPVATASVAAVAVEPAAPSASSAPSPTTESAKEPTPSSPKATILPVVETGPPSSPSVAMAKPVNDSAPSMPVTSGPPLEPAPAAGATEPAPKPIIPEPELKPAQDPQPSAVEIAPLIEKKSSETQLLITARSPKKNSVIPHITTEPVTKHKELLSGKAETSSKSTLQLPPKNLAAGNKWLAGEKSDHYTLQIIVLAADQAGDKVQGILHNEGQAAAGKFVLLKKTTPPATVILFYGEYPTLTAAKEARNNLPPSLQKYTPYPVAIKQAVEKSKR